MAERHSIDLWVKPDAVFHEGKLFKGSALGFSKGVAKSIGPIADEKGNCTVVAVAGIISCGFVDLQVNGGGGVLLNSTPTKDAMRAIAMAHRRFGTTRLLPTVITDTPDVMNSAIDAALEMTGQAGICGIHIEGPHISIDRRGTHKAQFIRPLEESTLNQIARLRKANVPTMITLAPDIVGSEAIEKLTKLGAIVSIGHSKATGKETTAALAAGASCFTHLFNAMSPMTGREPGVVGAAINSNAFAGIICDGIHVADEMVALAIRARPTPDKMFVVSDAMPTVGGPPEFDLYGTTVHLEGNRLVNDEGSLAGAHTTLGQSAKRLVDRVGLTPQAALRMAITIPGKVISKQVDVILDQNQDDLVWLSNDLRFQGTVAEMLASHESAK